MAKCIECKFYRTIFVGGDGFCVWLGLDKKADEAVKEFECKDFNQK